jgi:hypothetical protein
MGWGQMPPARSLKESAACGDLEKILAFFKLTARFGLNTLPRIWGEI